MFGLFKTVTDINSFEFQILVTTVNDKSRKEFFRRVTDPSFLAAPILVDAMFQTGDLLEFFTTSRTVLLYKIDSFKFYRAIEKKREYLCITQKITSGEETNIYNLMLTDKKGNVFIEVTHFEMIKLNSLDQEDRIIDRVEFVRSVEKQGSKVQ